MGALAPRRLWPGAAAGVTLIFAVLRRCVDDYPMAVDIAKGVIAVSAIACLLFEVYRARQRRPIAERWKKVAGTGLAVASVVAYFNGFHFAYPNFYHRWEHYHYYMGAKYFPELAYDDLYKCVAIAQDELGQVTYTEEGTGRQVTLDMSAEVRDPGKKIRNLGVDNLLIPVGEILSHPEECTSHFTPERWASFKAEVRFFRTVSEKGYWEDMHKDHGYNPPPVWSRSPGCGAGSRSPSSGWRRSARGSGGGPPGTMTGTRCSPCSR